VVTACPSLYTIETAEVASKAGALEWAQFSLDDPPRPGSTAAARGFVEYAVTWADQHH
jgi:hypothetical protein